jgi:hypothetical protein
MRIKFLINSPIWNNNDSSSGNSAKRGKSSISCFITCSSFFIKHYYDLKGQNKDIQWLTSDLVMYDTVDQQIDRIKKDNPDVLALSIYAWNESRQYEIGRRIREWKPTCLIVVGGPQLTAHKDADFFSKFPWVDYAVYGDGERAFQQIIDYHQGLIDNTEFVNIVQMVDGKYHVYPYERFVDEDFWNSSPYLSQSEFIRNHVDYLVDVAGIDKSSIMIAIEFARGCMYNCTFCDWSQNLTKKVKRRKSDWRDEIDFFYDLNIAVRETDANFGQWPEDREIYDYASSLYSPDRNFKFVAWNLAKLKKDDATHFLATNHKMYGAYMDLSFQDLDVEVLKNIDRPSLSWEQHKEMVQDLKSRFDYDIGSYLRAQLMIGLPGQTYWQFVDTMKKIWIEAKVYNYEIFQWRVLPNSPGADIMYQKLHQIKTFKAWFLSSGSMASPSLRDLYQDISKNQNTQLRFYENETIFSTKGMDFKDIMAIKMLESKLAQLQKIQHPTQISNPDIIFKKLGDLCLIHAQKQFETMLPLYEEFGYILNGTYNPDNKQFYSSFYCA